MEAKVLSTYKASSVSSFRAKLEKALKADIADDSSDDQSTASVLN